MENTYFDQQAYETEIDLKTNEDVLKRIYDDGIKPTDKRPVEFAFVTDTEEKAMIFSERLKAQFTDYEQIEVSDYHEDFEILGITPPIEMSLAAINNWNRLMWDFGYGFDCRLDGWQVEGN